MLSDIFVITDITNSEELGGVFWIRSFLPRVFATDRGTAEFTKRINVVVCIYTIDASFL